MPEPESWSKYGFPDDIFFRTVYTPMDGLIKALNERLNAIDSDPYPIPQILDSRGWDFLNLHDFDDRLLNFTAPKFVNPDKITTAGRYSDCFWSWGDITRAVESETGEEWIRTSVSYNIMTTDYPVKWAVQRYNAINILRYVPTSDPNDWPSVFTYADRYNTFNFKA